MFKIQVKMECSGEACSISALICTNEDTLCIHTWMTNGRFSPVTMKIHQ